MTGRPAGGAPVGHLTDLDAVSAAAVLSIRQWCDGPEGRDRLRSSLDAAIGARDAQAAMEALEDFCGLCLGSARRPICRHSATCPCIGADEGCLARMIASAAEGEREDAILIACYLVRADVAPAVAALAERLGLTLRRAALRANSDPRPAAGTQLH